MRIALLVPGGVDRSGTERVIPCLLWIIEGLVRDGHDVHVFATRQEPVRGAWDLLGARIHNIGGRLTSITMLAALLAEHRKARFDALHAFWAGSGGVTAGIASKLLGVPAILTLAGGELEAIPDIGYGGRLTWLGRAFVWLSMRLAGRITAPSTYMCRRAAALGVDAEHVPLGVALDRWPPRAPLSRDGAEPIRLLHIASLNRVKDQRMLLLAAKALAAAGTPFELTIIGVDTLDGEIQRLALALGLGENVRFTGFLPHHDLRPWVERADLLIMTSRHEAGPITTLEAGIVGVPTVGTAVGHIADFAPAAAVAVAVGDHEALAAEIRKLADDEATRLALAVRAQARAIQYEARTTIGTFVALYRDDGRRITGRSLRT